MSARDLLVMIPVLAILCVSMAAGCGEAPRPRDEAPPAERARSVEPGGSDTHPAWSPDGTGIAFISNREGVKEGRAINFEIYTAAVDGSGERRLTTNRDFEADIAWSPDGAKILFKSYRDGNDEVYVMDADGAGQRNLTGSAASDGGATWSPDGSSILFQSRPEGGGDSTFYLMNPDGSNVRPLPEDPGPGHSPAWSPDGLRVAFVSSRDGNGEIYVMDADGSGVTRLTEDPRENGYPRWSPDGRSLAHTAGSFETDRWSVILSDADGGNSREIIGNTDSGNVAWSPDGSRLLFGRYSRYGDDGGEESRLFILDLESGTETEVPLRGK